MQMPNEFFFWSCSNSQYSLFLLCSHITFHLSARSIQFSSQVCRGGALMKRWRTIIWPHSLSTSLSRLKGDAFSSWLAIEQIDGIEQNHSVTTYGSCPKHVKSQISIDFYVWLPFCEKWKLWNSKVDLPIRNRILNLYFSFTYWAAHQFDYISISMERNQKLR